MRMAAGTQHLEFTERLVHSHGTGLSDDLQELLTVEELATVLKVSRSWVYEHTRSRGIPRIVSRRDRGTPRRSRR